MYTIIRGHIFAHAPAIAYIILLNIYALKRTHTPRTHARRYVNVSSGREAHTHTYAARARALWA